ncbi:MAG TPA: hypothetical protein VLV89_06505, partial [Candidatus Acidoferrum sp.]|nr:hypothetical protein [Candidatus Acidoferrum sp.]
MGQQTQPGRFAALLLSAMMVGQPMFATGTGAGNSTAKSTPSSTAKPASTNSKPVTKSKSTAHKTVSGVPTFADSTKDDNTQFDDPVVREAAVRALGRYNGSVVAIDPSTGRILSVVNQKLAFSTGFIPCSTIKPTI